MLVLFSALLITACNSKNNQDEPAQDRWKIGIALSDENTSDRWRLDGANMKALLEGLDFDVDLQYVNRDIAKQRTQIEAMMNEGCKVIVITAVDGNSLGDVLAKAKGKGITIIAYDRLLMNTPDVDYYITFDNLGVGEQQGEYIRKALKLESAEPTTYTIEFFTGPESDNNVNFYFQGAMSMLQPYLDSGKLTVPSGQKTMQECGIADWSITNAKNRMSQLINEYYFTGSMPDAILCSNDAVAQGVIQALDEKGGTDGKYPVITGQDAEKASVRYIIAPTPSQSMTVFKDIRTSARAVVTLIGSIKGNSQASIQFGTPYHNGVINVKTYACETTVVDASNWKEVLIDSGYYLASDFTDEK